MVRFLVSLLALVLAFGQSASAQAPGMAGVWTGTGLQVGGGYSETWGISMTLAPDGSGQIDYPTLNCGGTLVREAVRGGVTFYRERITYGPHCVDNGLIGVYLHAGRLMWFWSGEATNFPDMSASAVLVSAPAIG